MIKERNGKVIKGLGGLYTILTEDGDNVICRAKGSLHRADEKLLIGDNVLVSFDDSLPDSVVVSEILPRKNSLIRPPLANLDYLFITLAATKPAPALDVIDKLGAIALHNKITPIIVVTKDDLAPSLAQEYAEIYRMSNMTVFITSAESERGLDEVMAYVNANVKDGMTAAFAGASGVGKSTLMNRLFPKLLLGTGELSEKTQRGKHTTRHVELFAVPSRGFIADTPGFSLIDFARFDFFMLDELQANFPDIAALSHECRYSDCTHVGESADECAVARAALSGRLAPTRLESYRSIWRILKEKKSY